MERPVDLGWDFRSERGWKIPPHVSVYRWQENLPGFSQSRERANVRNSVANGSNLIILVNEPVKLI